MAACCCCCRCCWCRSFIGGPLKVASLRTLFQPLLPGLFAQRRSFFFFFLSFFFFQPLVSDQEPLPPAALWAAPECHLPSFLSRCDVRLHHRLIVSTTWMPPLVVVKNNILTACLFRGRSKKEGKGERGLSFFSSSRASGFPTQPPAGCSVKTAAFLHDERHFMESSSAGEMEEKNNRTISQIKSCSRVNIKVCQAFGSITKNLA